MSVASRNYARTHAPEEALRSVLPVYEEMLRQGASIAEIAAHTRRSGVGVRGAVSSFADPGEGHGVVQVCAGTSCMLCAERGLARALRREAPTRPVYCLGYCDRSPAMMTPEGTVVTGLTIGTIDQALTCSRPDLPPPASVRCAAREAVVTGRLMQVTAPPEQCPEYRGLRAALLLAPAEVVEAVVASGIRGRGGAAYPTGQKWKLGLAATGSPKFIVANGDEGDPGSFIDRELMERDPHAILEGMAIAAHAVGASRGVVFIRSEYPVASDVMSRAIASAERAGFLGRDALGAGRGFGVEVVRGMGSYVCGEETALLNAIEGERGEVRPRPPFPVEAGLFGKPTVVDNVETLANMGWIMQRGAWAYAALGSPESKGTKAICLNAGFASPGIVEVEFGVTLREVIEGHGGGGAGGVELEGVLLGGPMGSIVTPDDWDVPVCFTAMARRGVTLGHAGLVAIPKPADWGRILLHLVTFMRDESCGKCVPCRLGSSRAYDIVREGLSVRTLEEFQRIMSLMKVASLCAFGRETPNPVTTVLTKFGARVLGGAGA